MTETFYDLLGVAVDADDDEIERAYRRRIKETHPDVNDDPDASERTARLVEARDVLTDAEERARYDRLGHDAYVGSEFGAAAGPQEYGDPSAAAEAARSENRSDSGPTNARAGAEERRRRERRARRDVDFGTGADGAATGSGGGSSGESHTAASNGGTATAAAGPAGGAATTKNGGTNVGDEPPSWSDTSDGWAARSPTTAPPGLANRVVAALREAPATATITFFLYPLLVLGTFFPAFPLVVNVIVGACLLASVATIQSVAGLGVAVYGAWTVLGTLGLVVVGESPFSPVGLVVLGATWLPLGFSVLTSHALDP